MGSSETGEHEIYMIEIQLRRIVCRLTKEKSSSKTDGDETMVKDGKVISKFSKQSMKLGDNVCTEIKAKIWEVYDSNVGSNSVFPLKSGALKIPTKFLSNPYSYELPDEYARGEKNLPSVKTMSWDGKSATTHIIKDFTENTPIVGRCPHPRSISRLVIVPKYAPGQSKGDADHGFRMCVNALVNKCLKPCASTIPLAADEIKKLSNCKYFLQADGANAYWSMPVCEESKRRTAFHMPDGIICCNRLLMGAKPSSVAQQAAYLEALDVYIDTNEDGTIRSSLGW